MEVMKSLLRWKVLRNLVLLIVTTVAFLTIYSIVLNTPAARHLMGKFYVQRPPQVVTTTIPVRNRLQEFLSKVRSVNCNISIPCVYPEEADLRIIVMTYNRVQALSKILASLDTLVTDKKKDRIALEIWIDRSKKDNSYNKEVFEVADKFVWLKGIKRVHIHNKHAGIYGQWIDTWRPKENSDEIALFLEDDLLVSPYTWVWLKAAYKKYSSYPECFGYTLQSEKVPLAKNMGGFPFPKDDSVFMYKLLGSWGLAPQPKFWRAFQDWFHQKYQDKNFHPYVKGIVMTQWYKSFERANTQDSMWTMWLIYYTNENNLYCVYNNLKKMNSRSDMCLAVNREEPGLHYHGKPRQNSEQLLLNEWSDSYVNFPTSIKHFGFDGKIRKV